MCAPGRPLAGNTCRLSAPIAQAYACHHSPFNRSARGAILLGEQLRVRLAFRLRGSGPGRRFSLRAAATFAWADVRE